MHFQFLFVGADGWKVDTDNPAKILEISNTSVSSSEVINKLKRIGFTAEEFVG
jgi:hypothetical protein